jgi:hypothetical protein
MPFGGSTVRSFTVGKEVKEPLRAPGWMGLQPLRGEDGLLDAVEDGGVQPVQGLFAGTVYGGRWCPGGDSLGFADALIHSFSGLVRPRDAYEPAPCDRFRAL